MLATLGAEVVGVHGYRDKIPQPKCHDSPHCMRPTSSLPAFAVTVSFCKVVNLAIQRKFDPKMDNGRQVRFAICASE